MRLLRFASLCGALVAAACGSSSGNNLFSNGDITITHTGGRSSSSGGRSSGSGGTPDSGAGGDTGGRDASIGGNGDSGGSDTGVGGVATGGDPTASGGTSANGGRDASGGRTASGGTAAGSGGVGAGGAAVGGHTSGGEGGLGGSSTATGGAGGVGGGNGGHGGNAGSSGGPGTGGSPSGATPGSVQCAGSPCALMSNGVAPEACCIGSTPYPTLCLPLVGGACSNSGTAVACDDATDCAMGEMCCGDRSGATVSAACATQCSNGSEQFCRTDAECKGKSTCRPLSAGSDYSSCK